MNLTTLRSQIAAIHRLTAAAFDAEYTIDSVDLLTTAINAAQRKAQSLIDLEYCMIDADLVITQSTLSGSITNAKLAGTTTPVTLKRIQHVSLPIAGSDFIPIEFLTDENQADRIKRQVGRQSYNPTLSADEYGIGETAPYAWQQGQLIRFGPSTEFDAASLSPTFTVRLNAIKFLPEYVDGDTVTVTINGTASTYRTYGATLNGAPIYFGAQLALWLSADGLTWFLTNAKDSQIGDETPSEQNYTLVITAGAGPAGTYTENPSVTGTVVVGTPTGNTTDFLMENGWRYLLWEGVLHTNRFIKSFANKQEGNIDEPAIQANAQEALQELIAWNTSIRDGTTSPATIPGAGR